MKTKFKIELGAEVTDIVTKIKGIVIYRTEHITGCNTYGVQPSSNDNTLKDIVGFDEGRLETTGTVIEPVTLKAEKPGADMRTPRDSKKIH